MARPRTVAIIGAGHYHATLYPSYIKLFADQGLEIVGIHDPIESVAADRAGRFNTKAYTDFRRMVEETKPEFVMALGRHIDMPDTFRYLVDTDIPFLMEKPWAVDPETFSELIELAESRRAWAAVPFPMRFTHWTETVRKMIAHGETGKISHGIFRMLRPGIQHYYEQDSGWMLQKKEAGGGVLLNLGCHGIDLCRYITGEEPEVVSAVTSHAIFNKEVEDYAFITLRTPSGIVFHNEYGYTLPTPGQGDGEKRLDTELALITEGERGSVRIQGPDRNEVSTPPEGYVSQWARVVVECLDRVGRGEPPPSTAADCGATISLIWDAYRMANEN
jgi:predicted dehydrogenase